MGVRGLTTYINNNTKKFLINHKLHSCSIILDGYSIATNLFISLHSKTAFGGNYDDYALHIKDFFVILRKCEIKPIVVFDGGYERRKLRTVHQRIKYKISSARHVSALDTVPNFPLFMRHIFREVLVELDIPFVQCDFEADVEIAALARQLQCPVLSFDSDFYIFDVHYIPFKTLFLEAVPFTDTDDCRGRYYLNCKLYKIDYLLNSFGGLDRTMLPLLAVVLGNDYINRSVFKSFFSQLKVSKTKKKSFTQAAICALVEWLRNETCETAVCKILGRMKENKRKFIALKVNAIIRGYTKCSSIMGTYLSIQPDENGSSGSYELDIHNIINKIENTNVQEDEVEVDGNNGNNTNSDCGSSGEENNEEGSDIDEFEESNAGSSDGDNESSEIPQWLLDSMRKGNIYSSIMDILTLRTYYCPIQVEDYTLPHSHRLSLPILSVIVGLLLGRDQRIRYWARNLGGRLEWFSLDSITETKTVTFPSLELLNQVPQCKKRLILLETLDLEIDLGLFPSNWQLFVVAVLFWLKNVNEPAVTLSHLHTIVMCIVGLQVISSKIGSYHTIRDFTKRNSRYLRKLNAVNRMKGDVQLLKVKQDNTVNESQTDTNFIETYKSLEDEKQKENNVDLFESKSKPTNITQVLYNVSKEDCVLMFQSLFPFHCLNNKLKSKPKLFSITTVHSFAQLQSCLHHVMLLNSILNFPLQQCFVSKFYSGMFVYNIFSELSTKKNIDMYLKMFFKNAPTLLTLYETVFSVLVNMLPHNHLSYIVTKARRKKKKPKSPKTVYNLVINEVKETLDEDFFLDENNKFSLLGIS